MYVYIYLLTLELAGYIRNATGNRICVPIEKYEKESAAVVQFYNFFVITFSSEKFNGYFHSLHDSIIRTVIGFRKIAN